MYYQECERLASEYPNLTNSITKIDELLREMPPGSVLRPETLAEAIKERKSQVIDIFQKLEKYGLLRMEEMVQCKKCHNLMPLHEYQEAVADEDEYTCSQCGVNLCSRQGERVQIYRVTASTLATTPPKLRQSGVLDISKSSDIYEKLPASFTKDVFCHTPLLQYYSRDEKLQAERPFTGKRALVVLHFLRDLLPFMEATFTLGLEPKNTVLFYKEYPYPQRKSVSEWLADRGCQVLPLSQLGPYLNELSQLTGEEVGEIMIVEDGGFCVPMFHRVYSNLLRFTVGAVEQTTRGIMNAKEWENEEVSNKLSIPVLSVAGSELKAHFEPPYIAKAVVANISQMLPNMAWHGKKVGLLGFGKIGQEIANWLLQNGVNVTIYEPSSEKALLAQQRGGLTLADTAARAASNNHFVIGASGRRSIDATVISQLRHDTYVVSASSEQYEIDQEELSRLARDREVLLEEKGTVIGTDFVLPPDGRRIHLLANGYPINFWGMESMPEEASDLIMSIIFLASIELARGNYKTPGINEKAVNKIVGEQSYDLAKKFLEIHTTP